MSIRYLRFPKTSKMQVNGSVKDTLSRGNATEPSVFMANLRPMLQSNTGNASCQTASLTSARCASIDITSIRSPIISFSSAGLVIIASMCLRYYLVSLSKYLSFCFIGKGQYFNQYRLGSEHGVDISGWHIFSLSSKPGNLIPLYSPKVVPLDARFVFVAGGSMNLDFKSKTVETPPNSLFLVDIRDETIADKRSLSFYKQHMACASF